MFHMWFTIKISHNLRLFLAFKVMYVGLPVPTFLVIFYSISLYVYILDIVIGYDRGLGFFFSVLSE